MYNKETKTKTETANYRNKRKITTQDEMPTNKKKSEQASVQ